MSKKIAITAQFKRDIKKHFLYLASAEWAEVLNCLIKNEPLPQKYQNHPLHGNWQGFLECHIKPDFLLIYQINDNEITLVRAGSHSELF